MKHKIFLLFFGLIAALAVSEIAVRAARLAPDLIPITKGRYRLADDPKLGYEPIPGVYYSGDNLYTYDYRAGETNSLGFRSEEVPQDKAENALRIAVLGDSLAVGLWIDKYSDTFAGVLKRELAPVMGKSGRELQILNFGVVGYNTMQEAAMLRLRAARFNPDLVVLEYCHNDRERSDGALFQSLVNEARSKERPLAVDYSGALLHSALYRLFRFRIFPAISSDEGGSGWVRKLSQDSVEESLAELAAAARQIPAPVLMAVFPKFGDLANYPLTKEHEKLTEAARKNNIEMLDLLPAFRECQKRDPAQLSIDEYHPSAAGHACAGRAIAAKIGEILKLNRVAP